MLRRDLLKAAIGIAGGVVAGDVKADVLEWDPKRDIALVISFDGYHKPEYYQDFRRDFQRVHPELSHIPLVIMPHGTNLHVISRDDVAKVEAAELSPYIQLANGTISFNEYRARIGKPLLPLQGVDNQ